jgi:hypothetical protein
MRSAHHRAVDVGDRRAATERHREGQFVRQDEDVGGAGGARDRQRQRIGRPIITALAPSAIAFSTSVPRRTPPSR